MDAELRTSALQRWRLAVSRTYGWAEQDAETMSETESFSVPPRSLPARSQAIREKVEDVQSHVPSASVVPIVKREELPQASHVNSFEGLVPFASGVLVGLAISAALLAFARTN